MITLIEQTLAIIQEMALTGDKEKDAQRIFNYVKNVLKWDFSKMGEDVSWILEYLDTSYLKWIIIIPDVPEEWKEKVWNQLLKQNLSNDELEWLILHASDEWKERAWNQLLKQNPTKDDLKWLIFHAPEEWKERAWEQLLKQNLNNDDLRWIILYAPDEWKEKAWEQLLRQGISNHALKWIMSLGFEPYKSMAKEMLDKMK